MTLISTIAPDMDRVKFKFNSSVVEVSFQSSQCFSSSSSSSYLELLIPHNA